MSSSKAGVTLALRRAPLFLRVVEIAGRWDALDQLRDMPQQGETLYAYERIGKAFNYHLFTRYGTRRQNGWWQSARYQYILEQPSDAIMLDPEQWRAWCLEQRRKIQETQ